MIDQYRLITDVKNKLPYQYQWQDDGNSPLPVLLKAFSEALSNQLPNNTFQHNPNLLEDRIRQLEYLYTNMNAHLSELTEMINPKIQNNPFEVHSEKMRLQYDEWMKKVSDLKKKFEDDFEARFLQYKKESEELINNKIESNRKFFLKELTNI